jgi:hypothetical protein
MHSTESIDDAAGLIITSYQGDIHKLVYRDQVILHSIQKILADLQYAELSR